jgi:hypothetical protein
VAYFLTGGMAAPSQLPEAVHFVDICIKALWFSAGKTQKVQIISKRIAGVKKSFDAARGGL